LLGVRFSLISPAFFFFFFFFFWFFFGFFGFFCMAGRVLHRPVLVPETLLQLRTSLGGWFVDATFGAGGHTRAILESSPSASVVALDRDPEAAARARGFSNGMPRERFAFANARFSRAATTVPPILPRGADGAPGLARGLLLDLGTCSTHLDFGHRGFSFARSGPLDMRMDTVAVAPESRDPLGPDADAGPAPPPVPSVDPSTVESAWDVVHSWSEDELARAVRLLGEDPAADRIAAAIVSARATPGSLETTGQLAEVVAAAITGRAKQRKRHHLGEINQHGGAATGAAKSKAGPLAASGFRGGTHPATRTFQAIRMVVNQELHELHTVLVTGPQFLAPGARIAILSYHSVEARVAKRAIEEQHGRLRQLGAVILPSRAEVRANPRARSAQLRTVEVL
jgi:16S rRNA (cytosine1402-N4)-methyltransferase